MTSQPGPAIPAAGAALNAAKDESAQETTDQGVPVGAADARADVERARDQDDQADSRDQDDLSLDEWTPS